MKRISVLVLCIFLLTGCKVFSTTEPPAKLVTPPPEQPATDTPPDTQAPTPEDIITRVVIENFDYQLGHTPDGRIPLLNGRYEVVQDDPFVRVTSELVEPVVFGDLNGDGVVDAAVLLRTNTGGSGSFYDLIPIINQFGMPVQAGSVGIGDRQLIKDMRIEHGRIILDYLTQSPQDPLCCPSQHVLRTYRVENGPILTSEQILDESNQAATPVPVQIVIDQPKWGENVFSPLAVRGRINRVPAQGYVEYALTDYNNTLLQTGQIPVQGEAEGLGRFSASIDFDRSAGASSILKLEIIDAENGMLFGRTIVEIFLP